MHVTPTQRRPHPVEAELQPDRQPGRPNVRKVNYTDGRTAAWVAASRIVDLPDDAPAANPTTGAKPAKPATVAKSPAKPTAD